MNRSLLLISILFTLTQLLQAQDSIVAENIYRHEIKNGNLTTLKHITEQNTYNLAGNKVIQLFYFDSVPNIISYTLFFYQDNLLLSKETFNMDKNPLSIVRYTYNKLGLKKEKRIYEPAGGNMQCNKTITYFYKDTLPVKKIVRDSDEKRTSKTTYSYNAGQTTENTKFTKGSGVEYPVSVTRISVFSDNGIISKQIDSIYSNKEYHSTSIEYSYDDSSGWLSNENWYNDRHEQVKAVEYKWRSDGTLAGKGTLDGKGNYTEYISYKYDSHIVNLGDQKMFDLRKTVTAP